MKSLKIISITVLITLYEALLIDYAANGFSLARNWYKVVNSMPVSQSNIEFVIFLGQIPVIYYFGWLLSRKRKNEEKELFKKYGHKNNDKNT